MKTKIVSLMMCATLSACLQSYPENPSGNDNKACNYVTYVSTIEVEVRGASAPNLLASVNGMPLVNECALGSDNDNYRTVRENDGIKILIRVGNNAAMTQMFFNEDGTPRSNVQLQFILRSASSCGGSASTVYSTATSLDWVPVYSNSDKSCAPTGYTAKVTN